MNFMALALFIFTAISVLIQTLTYFGIKPKRRNTTTSNSASLISPNDESIKDAHGTHDKAPKVSRNATIKPSDAITYEQGCLLASTPKVQSPITPHFTSDVPTGTSLFQPAVNKNEKYTPLLHQAQTRKVVSVYERDSLSMNGLSPTSLDLHI
jgi:hypothetical protein